MTRFEISEHPPSARLRCPAGRSRRRIPVAGRSVRRTLHEAVAALERGLEIQHDPCSGLRIAVGRRPRPSASQGAVPRTKPCISTPMTIGRYGVMAATQGRLRTPKSRFHARPPAIANQAGRALKPRWLAAAIKSGKRLSSSEGTARRRTHANGASAPSRALCPSWRSWNREPGGLSSPCS
jgi:hypothetical protein